MTKQPRPTFLKTFSEFTVDELRSMPLTRVLSLFSQELKSTYTERKQTPTKKKKQAVRKKSSGKTLVISKVFVGFTHAMKRVFTIHSDVNTPQEIKKQKVVKTEVRAARPVKEKLKSDKEETVVFSSHAPTEETPMNNMI